MQQPLKVMTRQVNEITLKYRQSRFHMMLENKMVEDENKDPNVCFVVAFQYILESMIPENREIIINDFIERKHYAWWNDLYTRSTYYRQKNRAIKELLDIISL
jgi:hypothetical protein